MPNSLKNETARFFSDGMTEPQIGQSPGSVKGWVNILINVFDLKNMNYSIVSSILPLPTNINNTGYSPRTPFDLNLDAFGCSVGESVKIGIGIAPTEPNVWFIPNGTKRRAITIGIDSDTSNRLINPTLSNPDANGNFRTVEFYAVRRAGYSGVFPYNIGLQIKDGNLLTPVYVDPKVKNDGFSVRGGGKSTEPRAKSIRAEVGAHS